MINYTINSTDPEHYNRINITLPNNTNWQHAILTATSLITQCNMSVLQDSKDKFTISIFEDDLLHYEDYIITCYENLCNLQSFDEVINLLNLYFEKYSCPMQAILTSENCIEFTPEENKFFIITNITYNFKILTGLYANINKSEDVLAEMRAGKYSIRTKANGFLVGTTSLYLMSTLGDVNMHNSISSNKVDGHSVLMRIQNSFTPLMPMIALNAEFTKKIHIGDITNFEAKLVDANLEEVHLLSPMWVSFTIQEAHADERDAQDFWQFNYVRVPRPLPPPEQLIPLNPELLEALELSPKDFS
jgi:hypothetical protein